MQFLGVGWEEVVVIMVVALVVVGPERLPNVAYQIGKAVRTMQSYARAVRSEFSEEIGYLEEQYNTVKGEFTEASQALYEEQRRFAGEMRSVTSEVRGQLEASTPGSVAGSVELTTPPPPTISEAATLARPASNLNPPLLF